MTDHPTPEQVAREQAKARSALSSIADTLRRTADEMAENVVRQAACRAEQKRAMNGIVIEADDWPNGMKAAWDVTLLTADRAMLSRMHSLRVLYHEAREANDIDRMHALAHAIADALSQVTNTYA